MFIVKLYSLRLKEGSVTKESFTDLYLSQIITLRCFSRNGFAKIRK